MRIPMTPQTVTHTHGHVLINHRHCLYFTMACLADNSRIHMRPVIEIGVVRQYVDALPLQRIPGSINGCKLLDIRTVHLRHLVAVQAFFD